jgi:hypothetical protein
MACLIEGGRRSHHANQLTIQMTIQLTEVNESGLRGWFASSKRGSLVKSNKGIPAPAADVAQALARQGPASVSAATARAGAVDGGNTSGKNRAAKCWFAPRWWLRHDTSDFASGVWAVALAA